ncbi:hypothetical protein A2765_01105 [Candidatus Kaiserbacteria bacterium RIFCSPHIGHO2_01_FULL_56_24]|uniref:SCP domain-containing protein n=1 Tax=Candidatus Kaiserbacteria bacterium RIFCSPHIGHO2_01_FULL_56_24 TaxID=1798487 RepID=A0A1F6DFQ8_9BACT|nr:MAG: hypothetical protein A2765_01105 [Candidatus Kaiserbacteria bacterium RIFCSPHIGHO2_01_FULL_56_24]
MTRRKARKSRRAAKVVSHFDPHFLKHGVFLATGALVVCLFMAAGIVERVVKETSSPYVAAVISAVLVDLANQDRTELALSGLKVNPVLVEAAQAKANDMAVKSYFAHTSPEGFDSWHWFKEAGYDYQYAGENLAVNFSDSGDVEKAWMHSPTHRDNIVNPKYTEIGIAVATGMYQGREAVFAVQMFGRPKMEAAAKPAALPPARPVAQAASSSTSVLGESTAVAEPVHVDDDGDASIIIEKKDIPFWGFLLAQPKTMLRDAYYLIGLLLLAGLFFDMEWEVHKHHMRHAMKAGVVLATMSILFIVADWIFFAEPILAAVGLR